MSPEAERTTRKLRIDPLLTRAGWRVEAFRPELSASDYAKTAVEEYETANGPADYALCDGGQARGVVDGPARDGAAHFLPGITDTPTLQAASTLCGQASWKVRGQDHSTRHDVATPDMIRQLPAGFALIIRGGCAPVIARLPRAWKNPAYRRARRLGQAPRSLPKRSSQSPTCPTTCPPSGWAATAPPFPGAGP